MIVLFTDFGLGGPYTGQIKAVLARLAPGVEVIELFADAPAHDPKAAAYLLAAYVDEFPSGTVFLCVVDPGVGGARAPIVVCANGRWFVGPDNGLFAIVSRRADRIPRRWEITFSPPRLSATFHGRDLFAPVAARIARGEGPYGEERPAHSARYADWPDDLAEIVYVDGFGNAFTGVRATTVAPDAVIVVGDHHIHRERTFSDVQPGEAFWYENANGLIEIAVNRVRADTRLGLGLGDRVAFAEAVCDRDH
jgi:S-adenosylmethionine hydrolase